MNSNDCIFCKIIKGESPSDIIFQTEDIIVIQDKFPKTSLHYLIIPKKHIKDISSLDTKEYYLVAYMVKGAQQLSQDIPHAKNFKFLINNGHQAGQRIFHLHAHFIAGTVLSEHLID